MVEQVLAGSNRHTGAVAGFIWVLAGTGLFTVVLASGRFVGADIPAIQVAFFRYVSALLSVVLLMHVRGTGPRVPASSRLHRHALRAFFGASGIACSLHAATNMPLSDATAIGLTQGMFVFLLAVWILKEKVGLADFLALAACASGGYIVIQASMGGTSLGAAPMIPSFVGLAGAFLIACEVLLIKSLSADEKPETMILLVSGFGSLFLLVPAVLSWHSLTILQFLGLLLLGPLAISAQYCNIRGFQLSRASFLGSATYTKIIFAQFIGFFAFNEYPNSVTLAGACLIITGSAALTVFHSRKCK